MAPNSSEVMFTAQGLLGKWVVSWTHGTSWQQQALPGEHERDLLLHQCGPTRPGQQWQLLEPPRDLVPQSGE